jgi:Domain of unknown function (DUF4192)
MGKTKVQVDGPLDVFDKIPTLLGFRPKNSLVILSAGSESDVVKSVKCVTLNNVVSEKANNYQAILDSMGSDNGFVLVFYVEKSKVWAKMGQDFFDLCNFWFKDILFLTEDNNWGSYICKDEDCCPINGKPYLSYSELVGA